MKRRAVKGCTDPEIGQYLEDFLAEPGDERFKLAEAHGFSAHVFDEPRCHACREAMLERVNVLVLFPQLEELARKYNTTPEVVAKGLLEVVMRQNKADPAQ